MFVFRPITGASAANPTFNEEYFPDSAETVDPYDRVLGTGYRTSAEVASSKTPLDRDVRKGDSYAGSDETRPDPLGRSHTQSPREHQESSAKVDEVRELVLQLQTKLQDVQTQRESELAQVQTQVTQMQTQWDVKLEQVQKQWESTFAEFEKVLVYCCL